MTNSTLSGNSAPNIGGIDNTGGNLTLINSTLSAENQHDWRDSQHFYRAAAVAMRRILIDNARRRNSPKHGGDLHRVDLTLVSPAARMPSEELVAVDEALEQPSFPRPPIRPHACLRGLPPKANS